MKETKEIKNSHNKESVEKISVVQLNKSKWRRQRRRRTRTSKRRRKRGGIGGGKRRKKEDTFQEYD